MLMIMSSMYAFFYFHDKNIISGAAYETVVVGSNKARELKNGNTADTDELELLFQNRVRGKCILMTGIRGQVSATEDEICVQAQASWRHMRLSVEKRAAVTDPEQKLRDIKKIKGLVNGT